MNARVVIPRQGSKLGSAARRFDMRRSSLQLVQPVRARARRTPFVFVLLAIVALGLIGLIMMSTVMQGQAFRMSELTREASTLQMEKQALELEVRQLQSPSNLARIAEKQGMVPGTNPVFLRLSDGVVIGTPFPAEAVVEEGTD